VTRFVKLATAHHHRAVQINPNLVRTVQENPSSGATIYFDSEHSLDVTEDADTVATKINDARSDESSSGWVSR